MIMNQKTIIIATSNQGKYSEIAQLVSPYTSAPYNIKIKSQIDYDISDPIEDGETFKDNALIKAKHTLACLKEKLCLSDFKKTVVISDDSGFCVSALLGAPGIHTARFAKKFKTAHNSNSYEGAMAEIQRAVSSSKDTNAYFVCALAVASGCGYNSTFEGRVCGKISLEILGSNGFGFDPIFIPTGHFMTFAQMDINEKQTISHRQLAWNKLKLSCFNTEMDN